MIQKSIRVSQLFLLGVLVSCLAAVTACSNHKQRATGSSEVVRDVVVMQVQKTTVPDYVEATGTVRAAQSAQLSSQVMGEITRVNVREGDLVRRGEVLITIDAAQQRAAYESANAGLSASQQAIAAADADCALAEATMKRYQMLYDKKSVSPQEYDEVKTRLAAATARRDGAHAGRIQAESIVSEASTAMGFTRIRAPFDGLVVAKLADACAMAAPGVSLLTIEDPSRLRLKAQLDESQIGAVHLGAAVMVVLDSLGKRTIAGKVVQIVPIADPRAGHSPSRSSFRWIHKFARDCLAGHASRAESAKQSLYRKMRCLIADSWTPFTRWGKTRSRACDM